MHVKIRNLTTAISLLMAISAYSMSNSTDIGHWGMDENGLPFFEYVGELPAKALMPNGKEAKLPEDPWFILGNYQLTVFPHVSGTYELITGQRSWARMNQGDRMNSGSNMSRLIVNSGSQSAISIDLVGESSISADPAKCTRKFGCGYALYQYDLDSLKVTRRLRAEPSLEYNQGDPAFALEVSIKNTGGHPIGLKYAEGIRANYCQTQYQRYPPGPLQFDRELQWASDSASIWVDFLPIVHDPLMLVTEDQISVYDTYPPSLFLYDDNQSSLSLDENHNLVAEKGLALQPGEEANLKYVIGFTFDQQKQKHIADIAQRILSLPVSSQWPKVLPSLNEEPDQVLAQEMIWNAYVLEAMATYSNLYHETKIPQGTIYDYCWGQHASARDNFQHALPLVYYNPELAKSVMRYMAKRTLPTGDIRLIETGSGWAETLPYNTSDQQLFFFLLLNEYLRVTQDYGFLDEVTEYFPLGSGASGSMLDTVLHCFTYLKDIIGTGPHGLIRLLNSDWNDNVYVLNKVSYNDVIYSGESHMNSAMALAILDGLASSLQAYSQQTENSQQKEKAQKLAISMTKYRQQQLDAFMNDLGNRDFTRRMYFDGKAVGEDNMYVEPLGYMLQIKELPLERKQVLYKAMVERIYKNEKLGARQQQAPDREAPGLEKGSRENGGMWYSMNGPIIVGLNTFDHAEAMERLRQQTFANYSKQFPAYWTSYWSASDNTESSLLPSEGLADQSLDYWVIPVFCAHAHAWPLFCYFRICEIE